MDKSEMEGVTSNVEETVMLNRNRSFKPKQLVRSQAIRESQSPPRTSSPAVITDKDTSQDGAGVSSSPANGDERVADKNGDDSSHVKCSEKCASDYKKQPVEIQITSGCETEGPNDQRSRTKRWLGHRDQSDQSRDLLSNNPRVACVCGNCAACPHCRGRRRKNYCPMKQDSGIVCSEECPDCSDCEITGSNKSGSLDVEDQNYYCRCPEKKEKTKNSVLTRNDSDDKTEPTGPELVNFIKDTLNKNPRDRVTLLKIEKELHSLVNDNGRCIVRFPVMTSYGRMLVHRCASLFQLSHHLDQHSKTCVVVSKSGTCGGRIPCTSFRAWCSVNFPPSPQRYQSDSTHARSILKRDTHSLDEPSGGAMPSNRSKSLEQRERDYEKARRRIFSTDNCGQDESQWPWMSGPVKVLTSDAGRNKLLKVQSLEGPPNVASWRSRGAVSKSHSFSGPEPQPARVLSRHGDLASSSWRLSPSSSGYKTLSLRSTDSVTPSPTGESSPEPNVCTEGVVWAVTDMSAVPPGALVIHPQTGRPLTNPDGSVYHFDPANPPVLCDVGCKNEEFKNENAEKKRGRLEKQHSFMDNECECQPSVECRTKCCSECRKHDICQTKTTTDKETNTKSPTPTKTQYDTSSNVSTIPIQKAMVDNKNVIENTKSYEANGQRMNEVNRSIDKESTNHQVVNEVRPIQQEGQELQMYSQYNQQYKPDEVTSPAVSAVQLQATDVATHKLTPLLPDPNIRPVSLTNMMYPAPIPQQYQYINHCRIDPNLQPGMYQPMVEEQKQLAPSPHATDNTFRIDASYPYGPVEYAAPCGACVDTTGLQHPHRSYSVPYSQVEMPVLQPTYPVGNMILQQPHIQPYPYQDGLQWAAVQPGVGPGPKLMVPDLYPLVQYPTPYPHYNVMYPQTMVPGQYPVCAGVYQPPDQQADIRRNYVRPRQRNNHCNEQSPPANNDIAVKIQQIKDQMAQLNAKDKDKDRKRDDWKRRSSNGILGSYPTNNNYNERQHSRPQNDDSQLSNEARVIVNSIRNMQAKNNYEKDYAGRNRGREQGSDWTRGNVNPLSTVCRRPYLLTQMSPGGWCRRSPGPVHPALNNPRRPHPDTRNNRR